MSNTAADASTSDSGSSETEAQNDNAKQVKCPQCFKPFASETALSHHLSYYHDKLRKRYACKDCVKNFAAKQKLKLHIKVSALLSCFAELHNMFNIKNR